MVLATILVSFIQKETVTEYVLKPVDLTGVKTGIWIY